MTEYKGIIETAVIVIALAGTLIYMRSKAPPLPGWEKMKQCRIMIAVEALSLLVAIAESFLPGADPMSLVRREAGKGSYSAERTLTVDGIVEDYDIEIEIPERVLTDEEIDTAFLLAQKEISESFVGENPGVDNISSDVVMNDSYVDGIIQAEWNLASYEYVETSGKVKNAELKEPVIDSAEVKLVYSASGVTQTRYFSFSFRIVPVELTPLEAFISGVMDQVDINLDATKTESAAVLPDSCGERILDWKLKRKTNGIFIFVIGAVVIVGLGVGQIADEKKKSEKRRTILQLEYSEILSVMSLLLGAGMSVRRAWERMVINYFARNGPRSEAYEEMAITLRQMKDGTSEPVAIESFGRRCGLPAYKKFAGILVTYIKKGSRGITDQLAAEVDLAFEERKSLAKIAGEQAGTKLLVPMIMLLGVTLAMIIVPALMSFSF